MADGVKGNLSGPAEIIDGVRGNKSNLGQIGVLNGIWIGGPTSLFSDTAFGRHLALNIEISNTEGDPATPSLKVAEPGFWRFQWGLRTGTQTIQILCKQVVNASPRPSMVVKANAAIGVNADITTSAPAGAGWVTIGPVSVTATGEGAVWVELWNNYELAFETPTFFDQIATTPAV